MGSAVHHFNGQENNFSWENSIPKVIPPEDTATLTRGEVILGPQDNAENFVFRYFVVQPGGHSTMPDQHIHDHGILILHGHGEVHLNGKVYPIAERDMVYVAPNDVHGLVNTGDVPMGFLCVIPNKARLDKYLEAVAKE